MEDVMDDVSTPKLVVKSTPTEVAVALSVSSVLLVFLLLGLGYAVWKSREKTSEDRQVIVPSIEMQLPTTDEEAIAERIHRHPRRKDYNNTTTNDIRNDASVGSQSDSDEDISHREIVVYCSVHATNDHGAENGGKRSNGYNNGVKASFEGDLNLNSSVNKSNTSINANENGFKFSDADSVD